MAEFVQTIKDWRRMCAGINCSECEIFNYCQGLPNADADADKIERIVTAWAAEHPEPVYPRWCDWLAEQGVLVCDNSFPNMRYWYAMNKEKMEQPIPADIAEKLGLQPKEG